MRESLCIVLMDVILFDVVYDINDAKPLPKPNTDIHCWSQVRNILFWGHFIFGYFVWLV